MPLDALQERIARTALSLPEAHTLALAGGPAMIAHGFVTRVTKDIDLKDHRSITDSSPSTPPARGNAPSRSSPTAGAQGLRQPRHWPSTPDDWAEDGIEATAVEQLRSTFREWHQQLAAPSSD